MRKHTGTRGPGKVGGNVDNKVFNTILDLSGLRGENEECLHLLTPHFAHGHGMSFGIKCLCATAVKSSPNHQKKSATGYPFHSPTAFPVA